MMKCRATVKRSIEGMVRFWTRNCWRGEKWQDEEVEHFVSSYGGWPGHETNYTAFNRLLWHMGREQRTTEGKKAKGRG